MIRESDRIKSKILALNLRLHELRTEMERTQIRIVQLEAKRDDARLAAMFGEEPEGRAQLEPQLEAARTELDSQQEMVKRMRTTLAETQIRHSVARRQEEAQARATQSEV